MKKQIRTAKQALAKTRALEDMRKEGVTPITQKKESELLLFLKNKVQF